MTRWRDVPWRERRWIVYAIVRRLEPNARGSTISEVVEAEYGKDLSAGWLYTTLERFEREGYLRAESRYPPADELTARGYRPALYWYGTGKPRPIRRRWAWGSFFYGGSPAGA